MTDPVRTIKLGAALVTVINVSDTQGRLADFMAVSKSEWFPYYPELFEKMVGFSNQCVHVQLPNNSVLVDASLYDPDSPYAVPDYRPPPGLLEQLVGAGVQLEGVDHVIITHSHWDHFNATTVERPDGYEPSFPNARHYLGRADWERNEIQEALQDPDTLESRTLAVLNGRGLLELVDGNRDLEQGVQILAAPGETHGHLIVRVESEGQVLYCLGDLYHHVVEVEHPEWPVNWTEDVDGNLRSRRSLMQAALAKDALLVAAHIPGVGRLQRIQSGVTWDEA